MSTKEIITYNQYGNLITQLTLKIQKSGLNFKYVYGIPRGGVAIALHLSHHLDIQYVNFEETFHLFYNNIFNINNLILIVDDLTDTGATLKKLTEVINVYYFTATIFHKPNTSCFVPDFYVESTDKWVVFPWGDINEIPNRPGY